MTDNEMKAVDVFNSIKSVLVGSDDEAVSATKEMELDGFKLACVSNAGLGQGTRRLTFLPSSLFTNDGGAS